MGSWGVLALDNDAACDWAYGLQKSSDLSFVENTFAELEAMGDEYIEADLACNALAACEVIARLNGSFGYQNSHTEVIDKWVAKINTRPTAELIKRASAAMDRMLGEDSELRELWFESDKGKEWVKTVEDLRQRMRNSRS